MCKAAAEAGQVDESLSPASHLEVSLYCMAPKRIPVALTELANGLMIPAMKPFTRRKLAWPMLEEPSTRKTISAACTLLHCPTNTMKTEHMRSQWSYCLQTNREGGLFYPELQQPEVQTGGQRTWRTRSTSSQPAQEQHILYLNHNNSALYI